MTKTENGNFPRAAKYGRRSRMSAWSIVIPGEKNTASPLPTSLRKFKTFCNVNGDVNEQPLDKGYTIIDTDLKEPLLPNGSYKSYATSVNNKVYI